MIRIIIGLSLLLSSCININQKKKVSIRGSVYYSKYKVKVPSIITFYQKGILIEKIKTNNEGFYKTYIDIKKGINLETIIEPINKEFKIDVIEVGTVFIRCESKESHNLNLKNNPNIYKDLELKNCALTKSVKSHLSKKTKF